MKHNMILSASGWRKVFAKSGNRDDRTEEIGEDNTVLSLLASEAFAEFVIERSKKIHPKVVVAQDTRPTGKAIVRNVIQGLCACGVHPIHLGVASAPEIMAFSKKNDGFIYVSASHNPIGDNGLKFGLKEGGVIGSEDEKLLSSRFKEKCEKEDAVNHAVNLVIKAGKKRLTAVYNLTERNKKKSLNSYKNFIKEVISGSKSKKKQKKLFSQIKCAVNKTPLGIVCDMNGSARSFSIDKSFINSLSLSFFPFNETQIAHEIIPEPENLIHCAKKIEELQKKGDTHYTLGYMPDCDGDRGNMVFWDGEKSCSLPAQTVFALCVLSELAFERMKNPDCKNLAVCVNCPTSYRIDEICSFFEAKVFRSEVGEANVVNLARIKRGEGYNVRILGEGSNGGNITYPSCVRDPLATLFALIKLLVLRDTEKGPGLFHLWCNLSGQEDLYSPSFSLRDIIETLPKYTTTGVSESRAILKVCSEDKGKLKERFKKEFLLGWEEKKGFLSERLGITSWECATTNGTTEVQNAQDWNNGNGGLKIKLLDSEKNPRAFLWMRPSGTENVFRILCDVKGSDKEAEKELLEWETKMILASDAKD